MSKYTDLVRQLYVCGRGLCTPENCERFNREEEGELPCQDALCAEAAEAMEELLAYEDLYRDLADEGKRAAMKFRDACLKWISVEERLPKYGDWVLGIGPKKGYYICEYRGVTHFPYEGDIPWFAAKGRHVTVTHWMPLPEPPKEDDK